MLVEESTDDGGNGTAEERLMARARESRRDSNRDRYMGEESSMSDDEEGTDGSEEDEDRGLDDGDEDEDDLDDEGNDPEFKAPRPSTSMSTSAVLPIDPAIVKPKRGRPFGSKNKPKANTSLKRKSGSTGKFGVPGREVRKQFRLAVSGEVMQMIGEFIE